MFEASERLLERARRVMPGGVNSPVRAFKSVGGTPPFIRRAEGPYVFDADGNRYIDFVLTWGPAILGHANSRVVEACQAAIARGSSFGAPTELEIELAEMIVERVPGADLVRLVNSGTEACMSAIRVARGVTGRDKIVKFAGHYHGHSDALLASAGSGLMTFGLPSSAGEAGGAPGAAAARPGVAKSGRLPSDRADPRPAAPVDHRAAKPCDRIVDTTRGSFAGKNPTRGSMSTLASSNSDP